MKYKERAQRKRDGSLNKVVLDPGASVTYLPSVKDDSLGRNSWSTKGLGLQTFEGYKKSLEVPDVDKAFGRGTVTSRRKAMVL